MKDGAIVLMYHNIATPPRTAGLRSLYVTPRMFRYQMRYLKTAGFNVVPLDDILAYAEGSRTSGRLVAITFDDGYQDFVDHAFPVLHSYNFPSTVYLISNLIGTENTWDQENLKVRKKLMGWEDIHRLKKQGVEFGSHTMSHPFLSTLETVQIEEEVRGSKAALEAGLQMPVRHFCYPYGNYDQRAVRAVAKAGYVSAVTTKRGLVHRNDTPFEMRRSFIRLNTHPILFSIKLHTDYEDRKGKRR